MRCYLVCFDIEDDKTRVRVAKRLLQYGNRVQKSVFELAFNRPADAHSLRAELQKMLDGADNLRFYYLNEGSRRQSYDVHGQAIAQFPGVILV